MKNKTSKTNENLLLPAEPSANDILQALHRMIDKKFVRTKRGKYVNPHILKAKMTLWSIAAEFINYIKNALMIAFQCSILTLNTLQFPY